MVMQIGLTLSIISFVSVSIIFVLYFVGNSTMKNLVRKSKEHENKMVEHSVIQDNKIRNFVDAVNNNDEVAHRENKKIQKHVQNVEKDVNSKLINTDENLDNLRNSVDDNMKILDTNMKKNFNRVNDETNKLNDLYNSLDRKYELVSNSNQQLTKDLTHQNEDKINLLNVGLSNLEKDMLEKESDLYKDIDTKHAKVIEDIDELDQQRELKMKKLSSDTFNTMSNVELKVRRDLNNKINTDLSNYVLNSRLNEYKDYASNIYTTKLAAQSMHERIKDLEELGIQSQINNVNDAMNIFQNNVFNSNLEMNIQRQGLQDEFDNFKKNEFYTFSNMVREKQQQNFENLKNIFGSALSNVSSIVEHNEGQFRTTYATSAFLEENHYKKPYIDSLFDETKTNITNNIKTYMQENPSEFQGIQGVQGPKGVSVSDIVTRFDPEVNKKFIDFSLLDPSTEETTINSIEIPKGRPGEGIRNLRVDSDNRLIYDKVSYNENNEENVEENQVLATGVIGVNGNDGEPGVSISSVEATKNNPNQETNIKITLSDKDNTSTTFQIPHGQDGKGIQDITSQESDNHTTLTFNYTDGSTHNVNIPHGKQGDKGDTGDFNTGNLQLNLSDENGLCINYGEKTSCISSDVLRNTFYTKSEYAPAVLSDS